MTGGGMIHEYSLFATEGLTLHNSAKIDWYNYRSTEAPLKVGTNSTDAAAIVLYNSACINGDVAVGAGGNPDDVIERKNSARYTGWAYAQSANHETPAASVPAYLAAGPRGSQIDSNRTITTSGKYTSINLGNSEKVIINGDVELYVTGNVSLGNSAEIQVNEGSSLVLYVDGNVTGNNSSKFNNRTRDPRCLKLYGSSTCSSISLKNSGDMYAIVYAPTAELTLNNSATIWGSVTSRSCALKNSAAVYYDASLRAHQDPAFTGSLRLSSWREY